MRDFPSCFGESGVQIADSSSTSNIRATHNLVTCVYECQSQAILRFITITWTKNLMGQGLSIAIEDSSNQCLGKHEIKPWLFSKRKGFKSLALSSNTIDISWDLSSAKFGPSPEPVEGFYIAVMCNQETILLLGDSQNHVYKKIEAEPFKCNAVLVAKKEHILGKKLYRASSPLFNNGQTHEIEIECETSGTSDPFLAICIDSKLVLLVKHLRWKFRGNHTILVDGLPVEVFWDVYSWLFGNVNTQNAVFLFKTCRPSDKLRKSDALFSPSLLSWSGSQRFTDHQRKFQGFSLLLYAWRNE